MLIYGDSVIYGLGVKNRQLATNSDNILEEKKKKRTVSNS